MKYSITALLYLLSCSSFSLSSLPDDWRFMTMEDVKENYESKQKNKNSVAKKSVVKTKKQKTKRVTRRKPKPKFIPYFEKERTAIKSLERFRGVTDGNVISHGRSKLKVNFHHSHKIPSGSYLECHGTNHVQQYNYRVLFNCTKLITPDKEFRISAILRDRYLVEGIKADDHFEGLGDKILSSSALTGLQAIAESFKHRESTALGKVKSDNITNSTLGGTQAAMDTANQHMNEKSEGSSTILVIKSGKSVVIEFSERFEYES